jgi:glycosyltransferase involved in cell wall biosynthesis
MKILYAATDQDLASIHGGTIHVNAVAQQLTHYGNELHLLIQRSDRPKTIPSNVRLHELPRMHRFMLWTAGDRIQNAISDIHPDVVIERYYNFAGEAILRAKSSGIPAVLEVNSPMIEYPGSMKSKLDLLLGGMLRKRRERIGSAASLIISPLKEIVPEQYHPKVREIEWGADTKLFDPASLPDRSLLRSEHGFSADEILLVHFGSLRKWHGVVKLLEAFDMARPKFKAPVRLIVIGPKNELTRPGVQFAGEIAHDKLPAWLKMSDLAVLPFAIEQHRYLELGFYWSPLKLFEAMAMQLPVLTLNHKRLVTLLGTDDPDFFYDGSLEQLSAKMISAVEKLPLLAEKSKQFRARILNEYSWEIHGNKLNDWLMEIVSIRERRL